MKPFPESTALQHICALATPSELVNKAFLYAKDNIARTMRSYSLGWGMSNAPHNYCIVVGRDTGWMTIGSGYAASWFVAPALRAFKDRQKPNGQIIEYIDMESGRTEDYGLNIADNTSLYLWAVNHYWQQFQDKSFHQEFLLSVHQAAKHILSEIGPRGLLVSIPAGVETRGITSWRNIIPGYVLAGEVTEINALTVLGLREAGAFTGEERYLTAAEELAQAVNRHLWNGENYLLNHFDDQDNPQISGDTVFPVWCGVASPKQAIKVLDRLSCPDFWNPRGLRTLPNSDPAYHPSFGVGLLGGSWPNLTLWYAAALASYDPDRALSALEMVALPVVKPQDEWHVNPTEFAEWFDGDTGVNRGMPLSPWVAPTFIWAVLEGLLGLTWQDGQPTFRPNWPTGWQSVKLKSLPTAVGLLDLELKNYE